MLVTDTAPASLPFVSVLVPARNEGRHIARCLDGVLNQDYPRERMEVIVADGMSSDDTRDITASYAARDGRVRVIDNPRGIVATGLNAALALARGEVIVRVDAHTEYAPDYVRQCIAVLAETGAANVGGPACTRTTRSGSGPSPPPTTRRFPAAALAFMTWPTRGRWIR